MTGPYSWLDRDGYEVHYHPDTGSIAVRAGAAEMGIDDLPDPGAPFEVDPSELEAVRHVVAELGETHYIIGRSPVDGTFPFQQTVGMEAFLMRMITDPDFVRYAVDAYVARSIAYIGAMLDAGCDAVMTTDDYSDNRGPIMGPERFEAYILPGLVRQVEAAHAHGGCLIKHTDGNVWPILDDFVEVGFDAFHPVQPQCMDIVEVKGHLAGKMCIIGNIDCMDLLPSGTEEEVEEAVRETIKAAGAGGGYILCSSNSIHPGVKPENFITMVRAGHKYGVYE